MEALVEEAPRPMIGGLEMGRRHSCFVWFARLFAHYPQLLDIVQVMVRPSWHAICALAMVAVVQWVDDGGGPRPGSGPSP